MFFFWDTMYICYSRPHHLPAPTDNLLGIIQSVFYRLVVFAVIQPADL